MTCGVQKHDDISEYVCASVCVWTNGAAKGKKRMARHIRVNQICYFGRGRARAAVIVGLSCLIDLRTWCVVLCLRARKRDTERERRERERKMRMRTSARASKTYYFYKLTSLHDHRPNTDLHKQTTDSSSVQLRWQRSDCNISSSTFLERFRIGSHLFELQRERERERREKGDSLVWHCQAHLMNKWKNVHLLLYSNDKHRTPPDRVMEKKWILFLLFLLLRLLFFLSLSLSLRSLCVLLFCLPIHGLARGVHPPRLLSLEFFCARWVTSREE